MRVTYEVRQLVKTVRGNRLEAIAETEFERVAHIDFDRLCKERPDQYFELVRVEHHEHCLAHNGTPETPTHPATSASAS